MKKIIIAVISVGLIAGLLLSKNLSGQKSKPLPSDSNQKSSSVTLLTPQEFAEKMKAADTFVVDVHVPEQTHIPGTDAVIAYDQLRQNLDQLPTDKSTPILVYCRSGSMSNQAAAELTELGYTQVYDLEGGTNAYKESNVSVSLTPDTIPLGTVIYGEVAKTTFTLTNYTPLPIKITRVSTSCGCTKASVEKEELGAYESTEVTVTFDPAVHKDDTDLGDLTRTIYISTDNPNFPDLESTITATVIKEN